MQFICFQVGPASHMEENSTHQYNLDQENDDYDEDIFKNFVENVDDLDDIEYSSEVLIIRFKVLRAYFLLITS